jgi:Ni/Co efflux regulator RcnB
MTSKKAKLLIGTLMAAMLVPAGAASAQTRELRNDRQDIREAQYDVRNAQRSGNRDDVRDARRDVRETRQEYREDWREYRNNNRALYRAPTFNAPFRYQRFAANNAINARYWAPRYQVSNVARWHLPAAGRSQAYVRHYNDLLLVNTHTGRVIRVYNNFYW